MQVVSFLRFPRVERAIIKMFEFLQRQKYIKHVIQNCKYIYTSFYCFMIIQKMRASYYTVDSQFSQLRFMNLRRGSKFESGIDIDSIEHYLKFSRCPQCKRCIQITQSC